MQNPRPRMRRLLASDLLPKRAGQPVKALVHVSFADLCQLDADSALQDQWIAGYRARWAAHRAAGLVSTGDGGAWLDGDKARNIACDAMIIPVVTGISTPARSRSPSACASATTPCAPSPRPQHRPSLPAPPPRTPRPPPQTATPPAPVPQTRPPSRPDWPAAPPARPPRPPCPPPWPRRWPIRSTRLSPGPPGRPRPGGVLLPAPQPAGPGPGRPLAPARRGPALVRILYL